MRLDRRPALTNIPSFVLTSSRIPANDTVCLSGFLEDISTTDLTLIHIRQAMFSLEKKTLVQLDSTRENRQECGAGRSVTLGEMRHFFALLTRELRHYQLFNVRDDKCL